MAESNLRTLLAAAKGTGRDAPVGQNEMEAILGVLKGGDNGDDSLGVREDASDSDVVAEVRKLSDPGLSTDVGG
jgi:hypothetical protein